MAFSLLTHRDHHLSISLRNASHVDLFWPINESFMEGVRGDQRKHPYAVGLKYDIDASLSEFVCEELSVSEEFCKSIVEDKAGNIKALVVALPSYLINIKVFPFPILNLCQYQLNVVRFLDH